MRRPARLAGLPLWAAAAIACGDERAVPVSDSPAVPVSPPVDTVAQLPDTRGWAPSAGPVLLIASESSGRAVAVYPYAAAALADSAVAASFPRERTPVLLLDRGGVVARGLASPRPPQVGVGCVVWPRWPVRPATAAGDPADGAVPPWSIGFAGGRIEPIPLDSVEALSRPDSARLTAEVARLASRLGSTGTDGSPFAGLPFTVRSVHRFRPDSGIVALVAEVVRRISTEADPREEHTLLVAERDSAGGGWKLAYSERTAGHEETVLTTDVLGAARIGGAPTLVLGRDEAAILSYAFLSRTTGGRWRLRWVSAPDGCERE